MPLLDIKELEQMTPVFRGKAGNILAKGLMKFLSVDRLNSLYDRNSHLRGVEFADAVLKDVGLEYSIGYRQKQIDSQDSECDIEVEHVRKAGADAHDGHCHAIYGLVQIESIYRPLSIAHSG